MSWTDLLPQFPHLQKQSVQQESQQVRWTTENGPLFFFEREPMILRKGSKGIKESSTSERQIDETAASIERLARAR